MKTIHYLSGPHVNVEEGYWLYDQLAKDGFEIKPYYLYRYGHSRDFSTRVHRYVRPLKLLLSSRRGDLVLLYDVTSVFILLGLFMKCLHLKRNVVAVNFMGSGNKCGYARWKRPLIRYGLQGMKLGVNSESLIDLYSRQLGLDKRQFFVIKDCASNVDVSQRDCYVQEPPYVFMGGNVHRDWNLFKDIVREMPHVHFVAALGGTDLDDMKYQPNLKIYKNISLDDFNALVSHCKVVFLPLKTEMQGGQLVAFQGSMYRKPVIITHCMSIDAYYGNDDVIKVEIGDLVSCKSAISMLMNDDGLCDELGKRGYNQIVQLTPESIYEIIKDQY